MGQECGGKVDRVARLESGFAKKFCGQLHRGDVPKISVHTRTVDEANRWFSDDRLQTGANASANGRMGFADGNDPFGAVARAHDFVPVKNVLHDVLRVESKINRLRVPAHVQVGQGKFGNRFDESSLTVPMLESQRGFEFRERVSGGARHALRSVRTRKGKPILQG